MLLVHGLLLLCSLFAVGTCTCSFTNPQPAETCLQLFKELERAVKTELNLFNLQKLFRPSLDTVPSLANITYVQYYIISPEVEPCPRSPDDNSSFINVTETYSDSLGWSNTGVYDVISPIMLHIFQPQLLRGLMMLIRKNNGKNDYHNSNLDTLLWDGTKPLDGVVLNLNLSLHCIPTEDQVTSLLVRTTAELTTYANANKVSNGYTLEDLVPRDGVTVNIALMHLYSILTCVLVDIISIVMLIQWEHSVKEFFDKKNVKVATYGMLVYTIAEFISDLAMYTTWHLPNVIVVAINPILFFVILLCFRKQCRCQNQCQCQYHFILQFLAVINFVYYILATIVPFVMLVFIYPMWAASFLLLITVIFVTVYIIISIMEYIDVRVVYTYILGLFFSVFVSVILFLYFFVFESFIIYGRGVSSGGTLRIILQFLPSVFLAFVFWLIKIMSNGSTSNKTFKLILQDVHDQTENKVFFVKEIQVTDSSIQTQGNEGGNPSIQVQGTPDDRGDNPTAQVQGTPDDGGDNPTAQVQGTQGTENDRRVQALSYAPSPPPHEGSQGSEKTELSPLLPE